MSGFAKVAIGLVAAALVVGVGLATVFVIGGDDEAPTDPQAAISESGDDSPSDGTGAGNSDADPDSQPQSDFADSPTGEVVRAIAPEYGADGDTAVHCIEQNSVGGFTDEELAIIRSDPNASNWPPGLGEKFAEVLEQCIPLEPFYLASFGAFTFSDPGCVQAMTDHVLSRYSWAQFIFKGVLDEDLRPVLQAEFDAHVTAGYEAKNCYSA